jgi:fatty-acyl-CoA synthase
MPEASLYSPPLMPELLATALSRHDERVAVRLDGEAVSYRAYREAISRWAQAYQAVGLGRGSPVATLSRNRVEVLYNMGAASITGCRGTPLHPLGSLDDHAYVLENAGIDTLVFDPAVEEHVLRLRDRAPGLRRLLSFGPSPAGEDLIALAGQFSPGPLDPVQARPEDVSAISFTGGTTGRPKGVLATYRAGAALTQIQLAEWQWPPDVRFLICAPLSHAAAAFMLPVLLKGGSFVVLPGFTPGSWLAAVEEHRITATMIVPAMLYAILDHPDLATRDTSSLQTVFYGTAVASPSAMARAIERFGPVFFQFYGQNEAPMSVTVLRKEEHDVTRPERLASCGRPVPWVRAALLDDDGQPVAPGEPGEICVQGPLVMRGYHQLPDQTADTLRGGWLHTGDIAREDHEGFWTIVDRKKDMIVSGGFNVYPREVEDVLTTHPDVSAAAVIGVPDDKWGEAVKAVVVPRPGATIDVAALMALVKEHKGPVYTPKSVDVVAALPLTPVGKPDKVALRERYWAGQDRRVH